MSARQDPGARLIAHRVRGIPAVPSAPTALTQRLLTGMRDPHVSATPAPRQLEPFLAELEREIDNLVFETRVRREIASRTAELLLRDEGAKRAESRGLVPPRDPQRLDEGSVRP